MARKEETSKGQIRYNRFLGSTGESMDFSSKPTKKKSAKSQKKTDSFYQDIYDRAEIAIAKAQAHLDAAQADKGKECGASHISKGYECHVGVGGKGKAPKQKGKLADSDKEEIKKWLQAEDDKIANPDYDYDDPDMNTLKWYRANLDPDIVSRMDELEAKEGYNWNDWGDISAAAQVVAAERVEKAMGVEKESWKYDDEITKAMEEITGLSLS